MVWVRKCQPAGHQVGVTGGLNLFQTVLFDRDVEGRENFVQQTNDLLRADVS